MSLICIIRQMNEKNVFHKKNSINHAGKDKKQEHFRDVLDLFAGFAEKWQNFWD